MQPTEPVLWHRPHPLTLLIEMVSAIRDLIFPIILVLANTGGFQDALSMLVIVVPAGTATARYFSTRYALSEEALHHKYGVLRRNSQVLPRRNIQSLSTSAGLIARATGLVELTASDASQGGDVNLRLLSVDEANRIMVLLRADIAARTSETTLPTENGSTPTGPPSVAPPTLEHDPPAPLSGRPEGVPFEGEPLHETVTADLVKFTAITSVTGIVGTLAAAFPVLGWIGLSALGVLPEEISFSRAALPVVAIPLLIAAFSMVQPVLALGGFRLWSEPDRLRIKTGLLTEVQFSARRERVQRVRVNHHLFAAKLGLERVEFTTADVEGASSQAEFLAPATALESWPLLAGDALGFVELSEADLQRVSPLTQRRQLVRFAAGGVPIVAAIVAATLLAQDFRFVVAATGIVLLAAYALFGVWFSRRRAHRLGFALGDRQFLARAGVVNESLALVVKDKVQTLRTSQSFFQRRLGLTSLRLITAGRGGAGVTVVPDLPSDTAQALLEALAQHASQTKASEIL